MEAMRWAARRARRGERARAAVREYLAAEARVSLTDARDAAAMHAARTRRDEALARLCALVPP